MPCVYFNGRKVSFTAKPHRDRQVTTEKVPPTSGYGVSHRLLQNVDLSKPCIMLTADVTGMETGVGYNSLRVAAKAPVGLEKVELELKR